MNGHVFAVSVAQGADERDSRHAALVKLVPDTAVNVNVQHFR